MPNYGFCTVVLDGTPIPAVLSGESVTPLASIAEALGLPVPPRSVRELLNDWEHWCDAVESAGQANLDALATETIEFAPPVPDPPTIYGAGANYYDHLAEMGGAVTDRSDLAPFHFLCAPSAMTGHRGEVRRPPGCEHLDWEVELAVVIGRRAEDVGEEAALSHVAGYTISNDISAREYVHRPNPALGIDWLRHKSFATLLPVGPAIIPARNVPDPQNLPLRLLVNGEKRQDSSTKRMIFTVAEQISALSRVAALLPGDLVLTGTPAGTAVAHQRYLQPGDVMSAEIDLVGRLENAVTCSTSTA